MNLFDRVKADFLEARKARSARVGVLSTLIGEIQAFEKAKSGNQATDSVVIAKVRSLMNGVNDTIASLPQGEKRSAYEAEREALEVYVPEQISDDQIRGFVRDALAGMDRGTMKPGAVKGAIMGRLAKSFPDRYSGQAAAAVIDEEMA